MRRYKVVEHEGKQYKVTNEGKVLHPEIDKGLRSDANAYPIVKDKAAKGEYKLLEVKEWQDYGTVHDLTKKQRKKLKSLLKRKLNEKQQSFCEEYILGEYSGNLSRSYLKAYGYEEEEYGLANASNSASNLFKREYIRKYTQILLYEAGFNIDAVDSQLHQLIYQEDDKRIKLEAIKEWNRLHKRISKQLNVSGDVNHNHQQSLDVSQLEDDELEQLVGLLEKAKDKKENEIKVVDE